MPAALPQGHEFRAEHALARAVERGECLCIGNGSYYPTWHRYPERKSERLMHLICRVFHGPRRKRIAMHSCDNKACIKPEHLSWGTQSRNLKDAFAKGRMKPPPLPDQRELLANGKHNSQRLMPSDIPLIRRRLAEGETLEAIAADYGVGFKAISKIKLGQRWGHVR